MHPSDAAIDSALAIISVISMALFDAGIIQL